MFLKSDGLKKSDSKCDLMAEKCDTIDVDSLDLVSPRKQQRKWPIFNILFNVILLVAVLSLAAWTMIYRQHKTDALSPAKIEDEIFKKTMKVVSETEVVLQQVRSRADELCRQNRESALQYVTEIRDAMKERTQIGVEKVNRVVEENLSGIRVELLSLETTTKDIFNGLVDVLEKDLDKVVDSVSSASHENLLYALEDALSQAEYEVHAMWDDLDLMYTYNTSYSTEQVENKAQNMTERLNGLVNSQRRYCDCTLYERVSMCYNITAANLETSKIIETVVHAINNVYNASDTVSVLQSLHNNANGDEHATAVTGDSTSLLDKYKKSTQEMLETLLQDHFCFLGSAVRIVAESTYPHVKRFILRSWRVAIQRASSGLNSTISDEPLIKEEYRARIIGDVQEILRKLGDLIKSKAELLEDDRTRYSIIDRANFEDLNILMENRFQNITEIINSKYATSLSASTEAMKYNVEFIVDQKVPFLSSLTLQNYLPTDVCPLAMDFANFVYRFLNTDLYKESGNDILDRLLPEHGYAYVSDGVQLDEDTSDEDTNVEIKIVLYGDDLPETEMKSDNTALVEPTSVASVPQNTLSSKKALPQEELVPLSSTESVEPVPFLETAFSSLQPDKTSRQSENLNQDTSSAASNLKENLVEPNTIPQRKSIPDSQEKNASTQTSSDETAALGGPDTILSLGSNSGSKSNYGIKPKPVANPESGEQVMGRNGRGKSTSSPKKKDASTQTDSSSEEIAAARGPDSIVSLGRNLNTSVASRSNYGLKPKPISDTKSGEQINSRQAREKSTSSSVKKDASTQTAPSEEDTTVTIQPVMTYTVQLEPVIDEKVNGEGEETNSRQKSVSSPRNTISPSSEETDTIKMEPGVIYTVEFEPVMDVNPSDGDELSPAPEPVSSSAQPDALPATRRLDATNMVALESGGYPTRAADTASKNEEERQKGRFSQKSDEISEPSDERKVDDTQLLNESAKKSRKRFIEATQREGSYQSDESGTGTGEREPALNVDQKSAEEEPKSFSPDKAIGPASFSSRQKDGSTNYSASEEKKIDDTSTLDESAKISRQRFVNAVNKVEKMNQAVEAMGSKDNSKK